eukprot:204131_1
MDQGHPSYGNGTIDAKKYFNCDDGRGYFAHPPEITENLGSTKRTEWDESECFDIIPYPIMNDDRAIDRIKYLEGEISRRDQQIEDDKKMHEARIEKEEIIKQEMEEAAQTRLAELETQIETLMKKIEDHDKELPRIAQLEDENRRLEYNLGEARMAMIKLKKELSHTLGTHDASADDPYQLTQLLARLQHQIAEERMDNLKQSRNTVQLKDSIDKINYQLADERIELKEQHEANHRLKLENDRLKAENEMHELERQREKEKEYEDHMRQLEDERTRLEQIMEDKEEDTRVTYDYGENEQVIKAQMELFEAEQKRINDKMDQNTENKYKALCMFTSEDVKLKIMWWRYNDVD